MRHVQLISGILFPVKPRSSQPRASCLALISACLSKLLWFSLPLSSSVRYVELLITGFLLASVGEQKGFDEMSEKDS